MKKWTRLGGGIVALLVGLALIFPAVAQLRHEGVLTTVGVCLLLLGVFTSLAGGRLALTGIRS